MYRDNTARKVQKQSYNNRDILKKKQEYQVAANKNQTNKDTKKHERGKEILSSSNALLATQLRNNEKKTKRTKYSKK